MHGAWLPTRCLGRYLPQDAVPDRALTARRQTEDFNTPWDCPHMELAKRRLRSADGIVAEAVEFIIHRQSDSAAVCCLLKDPQITEEASAIAHRTTSLISPNPKQRVDDPPVDPDLAKASRHRV
jgi:hypothetical protein